MAAVKAQKIRQNQVPALVRTCRSYRIERKMPALQQRARFTYSTAALYVVVFIVMMNSVSGLIGRVKFNPVSSHLYSTSAAGGVPTQDWDYFNRPGPWDEKDLNSLLSANKAWAKQQETLKPGFFAELSKGHAPKILWIGCSDARVPANEIIGEPPGSVFVHRNVANMVVSTDFNCLSVIQYAVEVLKVKHIVVCGHYQCGGVRASLEPIDHKSPLENWLRNIRDTYRLHKDELNGIEDPMDRQRKLVELNVMEQCLNLYKTAVVQKSRIETHAQIGKPGSKYTFAEPRIHALVYEPTTGLANKLKINMQEYIDDLRHVYDLYQVGDDNIKNGALAVNPRIADIAKSTLVHDIVETDQEPEDIP